MFTFYLTTSMSSSRMMHFTPLPISAPCEPTTRTVPGSKTLDSTIMIRKYDGHSFESRKRQAKRKST